MLSASDQKPESISKESFTFPLACNQWSISLNSKVLNESFHTSLNPNLSSIRPDS